jgi:hypothetical protein
MHSAEPTPVTRKVAPRWERVAAFRGNGDVRTRGFAVASDAVQWRVTARCRSGQIAVSVPDEAKPLVDGDCGKRRFGFSIRTGRNVLVVAATGSWEATVDQQLKTPIAERGLRGMSDDSLVARGSVYGIDQQGSGRVALYELDDGLALRFDPFSVTANSDLFVWVSTTPKPKTSKEALESKHVQIAELKATGGEQNYVVPDGIDRDAIRSIIIWCVPVRTAYAAATLVDV